MDQLIKAFRALVREEIELALGARADDELVDSEVLAREIGKTPRATRAGLRRDGVEVVRVGRTVLVRRTLANAWLRQRGERAPTTVEPETADVRVELARVAAKLRRSA